MSDTESPLQASMLLFAKEHHELQSLRAEFDELEAKYQFMVQSAQQNARERDALIEKGVQGYRLLNRIRKLREAMEHIAAFPLQSCMANEARSALEDDDKLAGKS